MNNDRASRKHGRKTRSAAEAFAAKLSERVTSVVFERSNQVYLWTTDRGRAPLIKH